MRQTSHLLQTILWFEKATACKTRRYENGMPFSIFFVCKQWPSQNHSLAGTEGLRTGRGPHLDRRTVLTSWSLLMEVGGRQLGDGEPWVVPYFRHPQSMSHRKFGMTPFARAVSILFLPTPTIQAELAYWPAEQQVLDHGYILLPSSALGLRLNNEVRISAGLRTSARGLYVNTSAYVATPVAPDGLHCLCCKQKRWASSASSPC